MGVPRAVAHLEIIVAFTGVSPAQTADLVVVLEGREDLNIPIPFGCPAAGHNPGASW